MDEKEKGKELIIRVSDEKSRSEVTKWITFYAKFSIERLKMVFILLAYNDSISRLPVHSTELEEDSAVSRPSARFFSLDKLKRSCCIFASGGPIPGLRPGAFSERRINQNGAGKSVASALSAMMERQRVAALERRRVNVLGYDKRGASARGWREWPKAIGTPVEPM